MAADTDSQAAILLVDDHPEQLIALEAILAPLGQPLVRATSGPEALRQLLRRDFAVILLDVQMKGMSGVDTARVIKTRERSRFIPIIFLTGYDMREETLVAGYAAGAVDYIVKPIQPEILQSKVRVFVELYRQQRRIAAQEMQLRDSERQQIEMRHLQQLLESEEKYRDIVAAALDAIVVFDATGGISMINRAAEHMFGVAQADVVGAPIARFVPEGLDSIVNAPECARSARPMAFTAQRSNGERFPIETSISCLDGGPDRKYTLIVRDVSERERQAAALRQKTRELEQALSARSRFFAAASHELRTPINSVLGFTSLLLDEVYGPLTHEQQEGLRRADKATRHLLEIVNDVLDLSKIEAGKFDVAVEPVEFPAIIEELFVTMQPLADAHGSTLSLEHEGEPITVISDPRRVRQILLNLLSNAIKFGKGKPIRAVSKPNPSADGDQGVIVEVIDQGVGISAADQQRIFQVFEQISQPTDQSGTGLGLPISRRLAEIVGGSLSVQSAEGAGSTFRLTLPPRARVPEDHRPARPMSPSEGQRPSSRAEGPSEKPS